jgi:hypothetical protein
MVLRAVIARVGREVTLRYCIYSILPIAIAVLFEMRYFFIDSEYRIKAYFSEPSILAEYLVLILLASVYVYYKSGYNHISKKTLFIFSIVALLVIILTSSGTGLIKLVLFFIGILLFENNSKNKIILLSIGLFTGALIAIYFLTRENNYLVNVVSVSKDSSESAASFVDRYYSFIGPISSLFKSLVAVGYGFGGDSIYYNDFYPKNLIEIVQSVKTQEFGIVSFWGKILVFSGFPGLFIWGMIIGQVIKTVRNNRRILLSVAPVLLSIYLSDFIAAGAFLFIHHWFWMAFIDVENIKANEMNI